MWSCWLRQKDKQNTMLHYDNVQKKKKKWKLKLKMKNVKKMIMNEFWKFTEKKLFAKRNFKARTNKGFDYPIFLIENYCLSLWGSREKTILSFELFIIIVYRY